MPRFRLLFSQIFFIVLVQVWPAGPAFSGPPFLTGDPEPVPFKHYEFYLFSTIHAARNQTDATAPAFEFNFGALPNLQIHLVVPAAYAGLYWTGGPSEKKKRMRSSPIFLGPPAVRE